MKFLEFFLKRKKTKSERGAENAKEFLSTNPSLESYTFVLLHCLYSYRSSDAYAQAYYRAYYNELKTSPFFEDALDFICRSR